MSRPKKAIVDYFPHYVNHGKTMFTLESRFGNDGYAFWFKTLELLGSTEQHFIDCRDQDSWEYLLAKTRINENIACDILNLLSRIGAIDNELWGNKIIWSGNFIENLYSVYKRREVNVYTKADIKEFLHTKTLLSEVIDNINPQSKVKYSKVKDSGREKLPDEPALPEKDFIEKVIAKFLEVFPDYKITVPGKERKMAGALVKLFRETDPNITAERLLDALDIYFKDCRDIKDTWYKNNMSLSLMVTKYNEINTILTGMMCNGAFNPETGQMVYK